MGLAAQSEPEMSAFGEARQPIRAKCRGSKRENCGTRCNSAARPMGLAAQSGTKIMTFLESPTANPRGENKYKNDCSKAKLAAVIFVL